jgi:nitric oxide dioxygenase
MAFVPDNIKLVGAALLWTLEQGLGNDWITVVKEDWKKCYTSLANAMINASESQPAKKLA